MGEASILRREQDPMWKVRSVGANRSRDSGRCGSIDAPGGPENEIFSRPSRVRDSNQVLNMVQVFLYLVGKEPMDRALAGPGCVERILETTATGLHFQ